MKKTILLVCFILTGCHLAAQDRDTLRFMNLSPAMLNEEMKNVNNPVLIDVREKFEFKKSRIRNAVNIPASGNLEYSTDTIPKNANLFLYCTSGFRSRRAANFFAEKGFSNVYSLEGGLNEWRKQGLPVEKGKPLKTRK